MLRRLLTSNARTSSRMFFAKQPNVPSIVSGRRAHNKGSNRGETSSRDLINAGIDGVILGIIVFRLYYSLSKPKTYVTEPSAESSWSGPDGVKRQCTCHAQ